MDVRVRYFASLAERVGRPAETLQVRPGTDVDGLWRMLVERHPSFATLGFRPLVALDMTYADWKQPLNGVREVAFLPPVSGG